MIFYLKKYSCLSSLSVSVNTEFNCVYDLLCHASWLEVWSCSFSGNIVALLHSFFSNLPQEWLEGTHVIIKHLRPVTSVAMLRIVFRIMGPLLPRLANAHSLFNKVQKVTNSFLLLIWMLSLWLWWTQYPHSALDNHL